MHPSFVAPHEGVQLPGWTVKRPPHSPLASAGRAAFRTAHLHLKDGVRVVGRSSELRGSASSSIAADATVEPDGGRFATTSAEYGVHSQPVSPDHAAKRAAAGAAEGLVYRVHGYFREVVPESAEEEERTRRVVILCFLEDDTIQVSEPREANSGLLQGIFVKRQHVPRSLPSGRTASMSLTAAMAGGSAPTPASAGQHLSWRDLYVGNEVSVFGRTCHIVDADAFSRAFWHERTGADMAPAEPFPAPPRPKWQDALDKLKASAPKVSSPAAFGKVKGPDKSYVEARLGGVEVDAEAMRRFLELDGKVLRFYCQSKAKGEEEFSCFTVHYFLADGTIEVHARANEGGVRVAFPTLLRRQRVPKAWRGDIYHDCDRGSRLDPYSRRVEYVEEQDLLVGGTVDIYGRILHIVGCDKFTQEYYLDEHNLGQPLCIEGPMDEELRRKQAGKRTAGTASRLESLQRSSSKPSVKLSRFIEEQGKVYRFKATLDSPVVEDAERRFIIACYPVDNTLSIFEVAKRNSGYTNGRFLKRQVLLKPDGTPFTEHDFVPGSRHEIYKRTFVVVDSDLYTRKALGLDDEEGYTDAVAFEE